MQQTASFAGMMQVVCLSSCRNVEYFRQGTSFVQPQLHIQKLRVFQTFLGVAGVGRPRWLLNLVEHRYPRLIRSTGGVPQVMLRHFPLIVCWLFA